jgi:hypothetical protein
MKQYIVNIALNRFYTDAMNEGCSGMSAHEIRDYWNMVDGCFFE